MSPGPGRSVRCTGSCSPWFGNALQVRGRPPLPCDVVASPRGRGSTLRWRRQARRRDARRMVAQERRRGLEGVDLAVDDESNPDVVAASILDAAESASR